MPDQYRFTCPQCGETAVVDTGVRDLLVRSGCVVCGAPVTQGAFRVHP